MQREKGREREREAGHLEWREAGKRNRGGQRDDRRQGHVGHGEPRRGHVGHGKPAEGPGLHLWVRGAAPAV